MRTEDEGGERLFFFASGLPIDVLEMMLMSVEIEYPCKGRMIVVNKKFHIWPSELTIVDLKESYDENTRYYIKHTRAARYLKDPEFHQDYLIDMLRFVDTSNEIANKDALFLEQGLIGIFREVVRRSRE
jgi:hypothetical protein